MSEPAAQRKNKPPEQFAEIGAGGGRHDVDRVAPQPAKGAATHAVIAFQAADLRFDGAASAAAALFVAASTRLRIAV